MTNHPDPNDPTTDVLVIGGGAAGLTAALVLARARHQVVIVDDGTYRNAAVDEFHGFPTRDATMPERFRADAHLELRSYPVTVTTATITTVNATDRTITVALSDSTTIDAAAIVFRPAEHGDGERSGEDAVVSNCIAGAGARFHLSRPLYGG